MRTMLGIYSLPQSSVYDEIDSPVGKLTIITSVKGLHAILWDSDLKDQKHAKLIQNLTKSPKERNQVQVKQQLNEYFKGARQGFDVPLVICGTDFQIKAWKQLQKIPYATTISYAEQAEKVGGRNKARAVGMANGLNPISIIIPCHRVIGSSGKLVGFGGGIDRKQYLLDMEKRYVNI